MSVAEDFDYLINYFFEEKMPVKVYEGKSGYNNTTRYLEIANKKYILRIYETHQEEAKVKLEHEVLLKLNQEPDLPFQVPLPVCKDGESLLRLPSHKIGCIYHYMEGDNPSFDTEEMLISFGESAGYLLQALKRLELQQPLIYRPYYELEHAHPNCPIEKVVAWCENPPSGFKEYKEELAWISSQLIHFKEYIPQLKQLPHQIIHGDLNASNVLAGANRKINAILDFEFTTRDLRIMEIAVCMSDLISKGADEQRDMDKVHYYFKGLARTTNLLHAEIEALPLLIQLRRLDVFLHFLGRYMDGIDDAKVLEEQISSLASYQDWMNGRGQRIARLWEKVKKYSTAETYDKRRN